MQRSAGAASAMRICARSELLPLPGIPHVSATATLPRSNERRSSWISGSRPTNSSPGRRSVPADASTSLLRLLLRLLHGADVAKGRALHLCAEELLPDGHVACGRVHVCDSALLEPRRPGARVHVRSGLLFALL